MSEISKLDEETFCDDCYRGAATVICCPLHAQAEAAVDILRRLVEEYDERRATLYNGPMSYLTNLVAEARPLLASIDGAPAAPANAEMGQ